MPTKPVPRNLYAKKKPGHIAICQKQTSFPEKATRLLFGERQNQTMTDEFILLMWHEKTPHRFGHFDHVPHKMWIITRMTFHMQETYRRKNLFFLCALSFTEIETLNNNGQRVMLFNESFNQTTKQQD